MQSTVKIFLMFLAVSMPLFSAFPGITAMGGHFGSVKTSLTRDNSLSVGLNASIDNLKPKLILRPYLDFWRQQFDKNESEQHNWMLFALGLSAVKPFNLNNSKAVPYVGGGLGMHLNKSSISSANSPTRSDEYEFDLSLHAVVGLDLPLNTRLNGFIELKYALAGVADYFGGWLGIKYNLI